MSEKFVNRNKIISVRSDIYDSVVSAAKKSGHVKKDGTTDTTAFVNKTFSSLGFETDDVKFIFRVPKNIVDNREQLKLFLTAQVDKAVNQI